jgi:hypothetical protein
MRLGPGGKRMRRAMQEKKQQSLPLVDECKWSKCFGNVHMFTVEFHYYSLTKRASAREIFSYFSQKLSCFSLFLNRGCVTTRNL